MLKISMGCMHVVNVAKQPRSRPRKKKSTFTQTKAFRDCSNIAGQWCFYSSTSQRRFTGFLMVPACRRPSCTPQQKWELRHDRSLLLIGWR